MYRANAKRQILIRDLVETRFAYHLRKFLLKPAFAIHQLLDRNIISTNLAGKHAYTLD